LSTDTPPLPVCGAGVSTVVWIVLWMLTTLFYYLSELGFSAE